ncbi:Arm DNA-binding domain-containing protein, partial [Methylocystis suflitae]|uniref:Arm DNA-binding domain-containing protein n=1 Tax=Methylocystis suflitae TaxID=2951405 RepID=UPI002108AB63
MKLTQARIAALKCPGDKRDMLVFDDEQRGLGVRVTAGGSKSYLAQYTVHGHKRRVPLGSCAAVSLAKAREAARAIAGDVAKGKDPAGERKAATVEARRKAAHGAYTLARLVDDWSALHLTAKRPRYAREAVRALRLAFADHLDLPAADLDRAAVVNILDGLSRKGRAAMAARTVAYGRAAYSWGMKRGTLADNPFSQVPVAPTTKRERFLTDDELIALWRATEAGGSFERIVRLLL